MIIFALAFFGLITYNSVVDNPPQKNTKEVYVEMKEKR